MSEETKEQIEVALRFLGINADAEDCDICEDGTVYWNLTVVLPRGSVKPE
ncbi:MAG: hypothetical protein ACYTFQ_31635 [Planctomycetota bacterium]|jgi:hypothetical protein